MSASHEWIQLLEMCNILKCMILKSKIERKGEKFSTTKHTHVTVGYLSEK